MKAAEIKKYSKDNPVLDIVNVNKPKISDDEVLIKIWTAGINHVDNLILEGKIKTLFNYKLPTIAGNEFVGTIEDIGKNVTNFHKYDKVYGKVPSKKIGAFAEYIAINKNMIARVPNYLSNEEAAAIPLVGLTAYQALKLMNVQPGRTIFISGGTGGFGSLAIPIAKSMGLKVITNGNIKNKEYVLSLGADRFIDRNEDYTQLLSDIDYVIDSVGGEETEKQFSILKRGGHLVSLKGKPNKKFAERMNFSWIKKFFISLIGKKYDKLAKQKDAIYDFIYVEASGQELDEISKIIEKNELKPAIDSIFSLDEVNQGLQKVKNGKLKGKVILEVSKEQPSQKNIRR